jgi:SAM-dependent methyltransferase
MITDPYSKKAKRYDAFVEPFVRELRVIGMKMFPLVKGMSVLDIGCGTGTHLEIYQKGGCTVVGIDSSPAMLEVARAKLTERAELHLGEASHMPFPPESFDLVLAMFLLHEKERTFLGHRLPSWSNPIPEWLALQDGDTFLGNTGGSKALPELPKLHGHGRLGTIDSQERTDSRQKKNYRRRHGRTILVAQ